MPSCLPHPPPRFPHTHTLSLTLTQVYVPAANRTWLHPYMSVVLGVTASIILCLLMTLCRRLVQRFGWGPFRARGGPGDPAGGGPGGPGGPGGRVAAAHMAPRQQGVPGHIIDGFHSYQYTASKAEREHLARNQREHEQQQAFQEQQQPPPPHVLGGAVELGVIARGQAVPVGGAGEGGVDAVAAMAAAAAAASGDGATNNQMVVGFPPPPGATASGTVTAGSASTPTSSAAAAKASEEEGDEPQCTVCLCEYEEGERITQLPCKHDFHSTCINK